MLLLNKRLYNCQYGNAGSCTSQKALCCALPCMGRLTLFVEKPKKSQAQAECPGKSPLKDICLLHVLHVVSCFPDPSQHSHQWSGNIQYGPSRCISTSICQEVSWREILDILQLNFANDHAAGSKSWRYFCCCFCCYFCCCFFCFFCCCFFGCSKPRFVEGFLDSSIWITPGYMVKTACCRATACCSKDDAGNDKPDWCEIADCGNGDDDEGEE